MKEPTNILKGNLDDFMNNLGVQMSSLELRSHKKVANDYQIQTSRKMSRRCK